MTDQTSSAQWREDGEPDPHGNRYDCERHELAGGRYTDDELANGQYMVSGDIVMQTMAKDRIRWLSRQLCKAESERADYQAGIAEGLRMAAVTASTYKFVGANYTEPKGVKYANIMRDAITRSIKALIPGETP
ncbi:MAG: hypothetical protein JKY32_07155 [Rhizobiales bacterium]|nr:hypothetical protein [Hyphomicrobiales bacterium]